MRALLAAALLASLVQAMHGWLPDSDPVDLARAILAVTDDPHEMLLLARIAFRESSFRPEVSDCRVKGRQGELGAWQILPRSATEASRLCVSLEGDARLALERIRESVTACRHLRPEWRLSIYTRGKCNSREGHKLSEARWVAP